MWKKERLLPKLGPIEMKGTWKASNGEMMWVEIELSWKEV